MDIQILFVHILRKIVCLGTKTLTQPCGCVQLQGYLRKKE